MTAGSGYAAAGVDIDAGGRAVKLMAQAVRSTFGPAVLSDVGHFGGLYDAQALQAMSAPVLVASTDGVGTKTKIATALDRWDTIGADLVNHCINDILVQGASPLFFMDYVATSKLNPDKIAAIVGGVASACREAGCALLGGETAEMPGVYEPGEIDLAGTIVGVVERGALIDGSTIVAGDVVLGIPSNGLHTNGFSLARRALDGLDLTIPLPELDGATAGDALLAVHRCYLEAVRALQAAGVEIRGLAHITGGGIIDNLPRILPDGLAATIMPGNWPVLPIFNLIQQRGEIDAAEMPRVFNMGLGMLVVVPAAAVQLAQETLPGDSYLVGEIVDAATSGIEPRTVRWGN